MRNLQYQLGLEVGEATTGYTGRLEVRAEELPTELLLDSVGLRIDSVESGGHSVPFEVIEQSGKVRIGPLPEGAAAVQVQFGGKVAEDALSGFYVSPLGSGRLLTTDLEPICARQLFPCIDRPDAKATFSVEVSHPSHLRAVSNMPALATQSAPGGRTVTRFAPTPPMATYLLYIGVGPLEELEGPGQAPKVIVAAAAGRAKEGAFALELAPRLLAYFSDYYGLPYPLPKLHLVAVPHYGSGAMENWGAITFQEYYLLLGDRSPASTKQDLAEVLAHEIAHQWFGNLVTLRRWSDLWLNESFATFVGFGAVDALFPEWKSWELFLLVQTAGAMMWDALPHTHPVLTEIDEPDQIQQIFDEISYGKGASLLRMAEGFLGERLFREGVSDYLRRHQWGNAEPRDLWAALAGRSNLPVDTLLATWVERPGFPLVVATREGSRLRLEQRRFSYLPGDASPPWPIPLSVAVGDRVERRVFDSASVELPVEPATRIVVNPGRSGFYRVRYDGELRDDLLRGYARLPAIDRWGLLSDGIDLFLAGETDLETYLGLLARTSEETDPFVLGEVCASVQSHYPLIHRVPAWERSVASVVATQVDRWGVDPVPEEPVRTKSLREDLLVARVRTDRKFAATLARRVSEVDRVPPELVRPILTAVGVSGGAEGFGLLRDRLAGAGGVEAARQAAQALGTSENASGIRETLELLFTGGLPLGVWNALFGSAVRFNPDHSDVLWSFFQARIGDLAQLTAGTGAAARYMKVALPALGITRADEVRRWARSHHFSESAAGADAGLDLLEVYERTLRRSMTVGDPLAVSRARP
ncbi:MAG TPA: M1 family aminopeptidase [Thermoplasmata archaeon]|nr:M1 family aminopeptidase [Thermoplasmata archaeon]